MKIEIDQSGKIENTNKPTVIAFSNSKNFSLIILSRDKKRLQKLFREAGNPNIFVYKTFAVLIFILIKNDLKKLERISIDREYIGYENLIKQFLVEICQKYNLKFDYKIIHFANLGKKSRAHFLAIDSYRKKRADIKITVGDLSKLLFLNKKSGIT